MKTPPPVSRDKKSIYYGLILGLIIAVGCKSFGASNLFAWCSYWVGSTIGDYYGLLKEKL